MVYTEKEVMDCETKENERKEDLKIVGNSNVLVNSGESDFHDWYGKRSSPLAGTGSKVPFSSASAIRLLEDVGSLTWLIFKFISMLAILYFFFKKKNTFPIDLIFN